MATREELFESITTRAREIRKNSIGYEKAISREYGITLVQNHVLFMLNKYEKITVGELAKKLGVTLSAVTQLVDSLEKVRLIERQPDASDRRKINLILSIRGRECVARYKQENRKNLKRIFNGLSIDELNEFNNMAIKLAKMTEKGKSESL